MCASALWLLALVLFSAEAAEAVADGTPLSVVARQSVFGSSIGVGNTLMEHDGRVNFAVRVEGSQATIGIDHMAPDASVVQAFLFWGGTFDPAQGIGLDRDVDLRLPDGRLVNNLRVDALQPGEPATSLTSSRCVQRTHQVGGSTVPMFSCRREVTALLQGLGVGGAVGTYDVSDVQLSPGDCALEPGTCEAKFGGWALAVMWQSPTEPVKRDLVLADAFFALDEQNGPFGGFSSGLSPEFIIDGITVGDDEAGEMTVLAWEGDAQLGVPPQNLAASPFRCTDGQCADFVAIRTNTTPTPVRLQDAVNRPGNLMNGSNNTSGGSHPGLDIDTFDIGQTGLGVLRRGDTRLVVQAGSGDGAPDDGSGGSGELFLLGLTLLSVETFAPRFLNGGTEKVVLEPVAGPGEIINYILRLENDGSSQASSTTVRDQLPAGVVYVANSTTTTCGVSSNDVAGTSPLLTAAGLNVGTLAIGRRCEIRFRARVDTSASEGLVINNFFTVQADDVPPLRVGPATTVVKNAEVMRPIKTVSVVGDGEPAPGATLQYRIVIDNPGSRPAPDVRIVDQLPAELEGVSVVARPGDSQDATAGNRVDISGFSIPAGGSVEVVINARIRATTPTGTAIVNQAELSQPSLDEPLSSDDPTVSNSVADPTVIRVTSGIDLSTSSKAAIDVNGGRLERGDTIEFRIRVNKRGSASTVVNVVDDLPPHLEACTVVPPLPPGGFLFCQPGGANGTGSVVGAIAFSGTGNGTFLVRARVRADAPDGATITNVAELVPLADPSLAVVVSSPPLVVVARPELQLTKAVVDEDGGDVRVGDALRYSLTLTNAGTAEATSIVVTDDVDSTLTIASIQDDGSQTGSIIRWTISSLAPGASRTLRFTATVNGGVDDGTVIDNIGAATANTPQNPVTSNVVSVVVRAPPALTLKKSVVDDNGAPFRPGDLVTWILELRNGGDGPATDVVIVDPLDPSADTAVLFEGGRIEGGRVIFDRTSTPALSRVDPGQLVTVRFKVRVDDVLDNGTIVSNQATATTPRAAGIVARSDDPSTALIDDATRFVITSQAALSLRKTSVDDNGGALLPGETVTWTLTIENVGDAPAREVTILDPLDSRLTLVSANNGGALVGTSVRFGPFSLLPGPPTQLRFVTQVAAPLANGTIIANQAQATSPTTGDVLSDDPGTPAAADPTRLVITSRPVLDTSTKTVVDVDGDGAFRPGDRVRYTIEVANTGSEDAVDVVVTDVVPDELSAVSAPESTLVGQTATFALGTISVGARRAVTLEGVLRRPLDDRLTVKNQASLSAFGLVDVLTDDPRTPAIDDHTTFVVTSQPRLALTKAVVDENGGAVEPGDRLRWSIDVRNVGDRMANTITVTDVVDDALTDIEIDDGGVIAGSTLRWTIAALPIDATATLRFSSRVRIPQKNGTLIANQATAALADPDTPGQPFVSDDPRTATSPDPTVVRVVSAADLSLSTLETFDTSGQVVDQARPGVEVVYRLTLINQGRQNAADVIAVVPLAEGSTIVDPADGVVEGTTVTFSVGTVDVGAPLTRSVRVRLPFPLDNATRLLVQGRLTASDIGSEVLTDDPSTPTLDDETALIIESAPRLRVEKTVVDDDASSDDGLFEPGDTTTWQIAIVNEGDAIARNVIVTDPLSPLVQHLSGGRLVDDAVMFDAATDDGMRSIAPRAQPVALTFVTRTRASATLGDVVHNQASASVDGVSVVSDDPKTAEPLDPTRFAVTPVPRVLLEKIVEGPRIYAPGEVVTYTLRVTSQGSAAIAGTIVDVLDPSFAEIRAGDGLIVHDATRTLRAAVDPLPPGQVRSFSFRATLAERLANGTAIDNQAEWSGSGLTIRSNDPATEAADDATRITVDGRPALVVTKTFVDENGGSVVPGDRLQWLITIENSGAGLARELQVTDRLDVTTVDLVDAGDASVVDGLVVFDATTTPSLAGLARGERVILPIVVQVRGDVTDGTILTNHAEVASPDLDVGLRSDDPTTPAPDDATAVLIRAPRLLVTKATAVNAFAPGDLAEFTIDVVNQGGADAIDVVIRDVLPVVLTEPTTTSGAIVDGVVVSDVARIAPDERVTMVVRGVIDPLASGGTLLSNQAEVLARGLSAVLSDDPSTSTIGDATTRPIDADERYIGTLILQDASSGQTIAPGGFVAPGQRLRALVTVRSDGRQAGRSVTLTSQWPPTSFLVDEVSDGGRIDDENAVSFGPEQLPALAVMAPGASVAVSFAGRIPSSAPAGSEVTFSLQVDSLGEATPTVIGPVTVVVLTDADLSATTKEVVDRNGSAVEPGDVLDWTITARNGGQTAAVDVILSDAIPPGMRLVEGSLVVAGAAAVLADLAQGIALGSIEPNGTVVVSFSTRVERSVPRGAVISNQAIVSATSRFGHRAEARSDDPRTPLVRGDPTSVVVGGGALLVSGLVGSPSPTTTATPTIITAVIDSVGTEAAVDVVLTLPRPAGTNLVAGSWQLDGGPCSEAVDVDPCTLLGDTVQVRRARLAPGEGLRLSVTVVPTDGLTAIVAQGDVSSPPLQVPTDADPTTPGAQPLVIPIVGEPSLLFDEHTLELVDVDGGVLRAGDRVTVRAPLKNRGATAAEVSTVSIRLSAGLRVDADALTQADPALVVSDGEVTIRDGGTFVVDAEGQRDIVIPCIVADELARGAVIQATGQALARLTTTDESAIVELGSDSLTIGLLPGTGALSGRLFLDAGARDGRFVGDDGDIAIDGFEVAAFGPHRDEPVQRVVTDREGRYALSPLPAGPTRLVIRSPAGAFFGTIEVDDLGDGEVRSRDLAIEPTGSVYVTTPHRSPRGLMVRLLVDDGDGDPRNDQPVEASRLREGQHDQVVSAQGLYRFDPPPGAYRLEVRSDSPLLVFPSSKVPALADGSNALGQQMGPGDVSDVVVIAEGVSAPWAARLRFDETGAPRRNHLPVDALSDQLAITKAATRKRASIGEIVTYEVRVENKALVDRLQRDGAGAEIVDTLPPGFQLVDGSYQLAEIATDDDGTLRRKIVPSVQATGTRVVRFGPFDLFGQRSYVLRYNVVVGPGAGIGRHENTAALQLAEGAIALTETASAIVDVVADDTFDLGNIRGKVFCDDDGDGRQSASERGLWGARIYLDNGTYTEADVTGKWHFSGVAPGMHLAKIDERTAPTTTASALRQSFYLSAGLPAQVNFPLRCPAPVELSPTELVVNAEAYKDQNDDAPTLHVAGTLSPLRLTVDGVPISAPDVALELSARGTEPAPSGPNLESPTAGLVLRPRLTTTAAVAAWRIVIDDLGQPQPAAEAPTARESLQGEARVVDVATFERSLTTEPGTDGGARPIPPVTTTWATASPRPIWIMAGRGAPPPELSWNGTDDGTKLAVLVDGHLYGATLTIELVDGQRATTARVPFGVRVGVAAGATDAPLVVVAVIDEEDGPLFSSSGRPTRRLKAALATYEPLLRDAEHLEIRAHLDRRQNEPAAAQSAARAEVVRTLLIERGLAAERLVAIGRGDDEPLFPNGRARDRKKNRRIECIIPSKRAALPALPTLTAPTPVSTLLVAETPVIPTADGAVDAQVPHRPGVVPFIDVETEGRRLRLLKPGDEHAAAPSASLPWSIHVESNTSLSIAAMPVRTDALLGVRVGPIAPGGAVFLRVPPQVEAVATTVRVWADRPEWPDIVSDDTVLGPALAEARVDGAPSLVTLGDALAVGTAVRIRAVVKDAAGQIGISPDWRGVIEAPSIQAAAPPTAPSLRTLTTAETTRRTITLEDPVVGEVLRDQTQAVLLQFVRELPADATLIIEAHTDDEGPRLLHLARSQRHAEIGKDVVVAAGILAERVEVIGRGSDDAVVPNTSARNRARNRRLVITATPPTTVADEPASRVSELRVNGEALTLTEGRFVGEVAPTTADMLALTLQLQNGARAALLVRRDAGPPWQGTPAAFADTVRTAVVEPSPQNTASTGDADATAPDDADRAPFTGQGSRPPWWPLRSRVPAASLVVEWPSEGPLTQQAMTLGGRVDPASRVTINNDVVAVDPLTGRFLTRVKLIEGPGQILVEATDSLGNVARVRRDVVVDTTGWFVLLLGDGAVGQDGAQLDERSATTSVTLGPAFFYGRGVAYVKGRFQGPTLFRDYDLTLHLDTRRFDNDVFFRDVLDPDRFMPAWGDSSFEVQDARSGLPLYIDLKADASSLSVGNIRTELVAGDLLRYQRARTGAQLTFDRGWLDPINVAARPRDAVVSPSTDPFRTRATTFVAGGGGERHARVELMGTGGSVYFLRHERLVEGSERMAILVRDGVTGAEIARRPLQRNIDYTIRYDEGRVLMKEPVQAFADAAFITNHNLGQVASGHRVFVEAEYEHRDDRRVQGLAGGVDVEQRIFGLFSLGGTYVIEGRDDGGLSYQVGGVRAKLARDEGTFVKAELLMSQSVDAGNFVSFDGGLTYDALGQRLDQKAVRIGNSIYPAERAGAGFKLDGQWRFGDLVGRNADDGIARAYYQALEPGFFGGGGGIVEQGQTKWGAEVAYRLTATDELRLRYDGVVAEINPLEPVTAPRTLHRHLGTGRYAKKLTPGLSVAGEVGYGYTADSGRFGPPVDDGDPAQARDFHTLITAAGVDWQVIEPLTLSLKQEVIALGDPTQLRAWNDHLITHVVARYALTEALSVDGGASVRWSGENQVHAGVGYRLNSTSRVYVSERLGMLATPGTGTMGFSHTTVVGGETELAKGSTAYAEYQLQSAFSSEQTRGVVGLKNRWALPFGFALSLNYERITTIAGTTPTTSSSGIVTPAAFTDGTFYATPGQNAGGAMLAGDGSRDAVSAGVEWRRDDLLLFTQRLELRADNVAESRGGHDTVWLVSMSSLALKVSPELSMLARYNVAQAHDLALGQRVAALEEGTVGAAFRPISHDWLSVLFKLSRRVDVRPIGLPGSGVDDSAIHASSVEPIVELPWGVQLVEKLALKHMSVVFDDVPQAHALTALWINRLNGKTFSLLRRLGIEPPFPGAVDVGVEYRILSGLSYAAIEHGVLMELQVAPIDQLRIGVGYNFTRFSDNELERSTLEGGAVDRSGFFIRAVGSW